MISNFTREVQSFLKTPQVSIISILFFKLQVFTNEIQYYYKYTTLRLGLLIFGGFFSVIHYTLIIIIVHLMRVCVIVSLTKNDNNIIFKGGIKKVRSSWCGFRTECSLNKIWYPVRFVYKTRNKIDLCSVMFGFQNIRISIFLLQNSKPTSNTNR